MIKDTLLPKKTILQGNSYNYCIEKTLGQGTFGITYLATTRFVVKGSLGNIETEVNVAIKEFFMRDINGRSDMIVTSGSKGGIYDDYKKKFIREALNLSRLQHPNIIKVIESFEANNTVYYVMEYISGGSLDDYIARNNGLKEDEAIKTVKQVGSALSYMHSQGMVHLDLKPSNIMRKDTGDVVLIDFGLSKQYDESGEPESSTKVGAGTPGYAPLEQTNYREGKEFPVTMDVYALGATLFKMLTGKRPPEASEILNEGFPMYELHEKNVNDGVSACIIKAMSPQKKNRYKTIAEFIESFDDEVTIADVEIVSTPTKIDSDIKGKILTVRKNTSKVTFEFYPRTPLLQGAYFCSVSRDKGVDTNITQESKHACCNLSKCEYQNFLNDLQSLNLLYKDVENPPYRQHEYSENPAKLTITLYDNNGIIYNSVWISGWDSELGNIGGNIYDIENKVRRIVPMLQEYLDSSDYKYPDIKKTIHNDNKSFQKVKHVADNKTETGTKEPPYNDQQNSLFSKKRWMVFAITFILLICFATYLKYNKNTTSSLPTETKVTNDTISLTKKTLPIPTNFVLVPGGQYNSKIHLDSFYIDKYELTQYEYKKYMGELKKENYSYRYDDRYYNPIIKEYIEDSLPVVGTYRQFVTYCQNRSLKEGYDGFYEITDNSIKLKEDGNGYRLINAYEWLFAAKGGTNKEQYKYIGGNKLGEVAWFGGNSKNRPHNVGGKTPNSLGLYDMAGNISEMFEDIAPNGSHYSPYGEYNSWVGFNDQIVYGASATEKIGDMNGTRIVLIPYNLKNTNTKLNFSYDN